MTAATPDALRALLRSEDVEGALALCVGASGAGADRLRTALAGWLDEAWAARREVTAEGAWVRWRAGEIDGSTEAYRVARACAFALMRASDLRRESYSRRPEAADAERVARLRGRRWATSIAQAYCDHWPGKPTWDLVRPWVRAGICDRPEGEGWVQSLMLLNFRPPKPLRDVLLEEADLLGDELWRLFATEGSGQNSLAARDKFEQDEHQWSVALAALSAEGRIPRGRLLDATLDALARDFAHFRAGWFSRFHDRLAPTDDEVAARTDRYVRLLGSRLGPTVALALRCLRRLDRAGALPAESFLAAAPDALRCRAKATAVAALRMLDGVARRDASCGPAAARVAAAALAHESADVQSAALDLIERHGSPADADLRAAVAPCADSVAAILRGRVAPFAEDVADAAPPATPAADDWGDAALGTSADESPLAPGRRVQPIADFADLVAAFAHVVERFDAGLLERVLAAAVRHGPPRDDAERRLAAPLAKRTANLGADSFPPGVVRLAATWAGGAPWNDRVGGMAVFKVWSDPDGPYSREARAAVSLPGGPGDPPTLYGGEQSRRFVAARLGAIAASFLAGGRAALLSEPTHAGGWIDPVTLAGRVLAGGAPDDVHDRVLALLRLAPERRGEALDLLRGAPGEFAAALRHALGADCETVGPTAALWIAAARARAPFEDDPRVAAAHPGLGPDGAEAARYVLPVLPPPAKDALPYPYAPTFVVRLPWPPRPLPSAHLTVLLHARQDDWGRPLDDASVEWLATATPSNHEPLFAVAVEMLLGGYEVGDQVVGLVGPLTGPHVHWDGLGPTALAVALGAPSADVRQRATDALVEAAPRGRLAPARLGEALAWAAGTGRVPCGRLAKSLTQAALASGGHAEFVAAAVEASLRGEPARFPRDLVALLDLLLDLCARTGRRVTTFAARAFLAGVRGARTGRTAAALLGVAPA